MTIGYRPYAASLWEPEDFVFISEMIATASEADLGALRKKPRHFNTLQTARSSFPGVLWHARRGSENKRVIVRFVSLTLLSVSPRIPFSHYRREGLWLSKEAPLPLTNVPAFPLKVKRKVNTSAYCVWFMWLMLGLLISRTNDALVELGTQEATVPES